MDMRFSQVMPTNLLKIKVEFYMGYPSNQIGDLHHANLGTKRELLVRTKITNQMEIFMDNLRNQVTSFSSDEAHKPNKDFKRKSHKPNESFCWLTSKTKHQLRTRDITEKINSSRINYNYTPTPKQTKKSQ